MKKILSFVLVLVLVLAMLASCAPEQPDEEDTSESDTSESTSNTEESTSDTEESDDGEESSSESETEETKKEESTKVEILKGGKYRYRIAVSKDATEGVMNAAEHVANRLKKKTGVAIEIVTDNQCSEDESLILVGVTKFNSSKSALATIAPNEYIIKFVDNHLIIAGYAEMTTQIAANAFEGIVLSKAKVTSSSAGKNLYLESDLLVQDENNVSMENLTAFDKGTYVDTYPCANGVTQMYYMGVSKNDIKPYVTILNASGYLTKESNQIGENQHVTCVGKNGMIHLNYINENRTLSVIYDPLKEHAYKDSEPKYTPLGDNTFAVMARDYTIQNIMDGNGESYVINLEDGRYVIIDGGYANCGDDDALYNYMKANNRRSDGKIVIAAWIFTHSHGDHIGAFQTFTNNYSSLVSVEYFVYNTGTQDMYRAGQHNTYLESSFESVRQTYYPNAKILKPHTGQTLTFCNVDFEILYTHENYVQMQSTTNNAIEMPWENDSSLVFRIQLDGMSFLMMGDCEATSSEVICRMYGDKLKSDVIQVNHHGYSGGTMQLYQLSAPSYALWTTSQPAFELRVSGEDNIKANNYKFVSSSVYESNRHIYLAVGVENNFVADGQIKILTVNNRAFEIAYQDVDFEDHR